MFSSSNKMDPGQVELKDLTLIEQQLICRNAQSMAMHLLNHGGIGSSVTVSHFPKK